MGPRKEPKTRQDTVLLPPPPPPPQVFAPIAVLRSFADTLDHVMEMSEDALAAAAAKGIELPGGGKIDPIVINDMTSYRPFQVGGLCWALGLSVVLRWMDPIGDRCAGCFCRPV